MSTHPKCYPNNVLPDEERFDVEGDSESTSLLAPHARLSYIAGLLGVRASTANLPDVKNGCWETLHGEKHDSTRWDGSRSSYKPRNFAWVVTAPSKISRCTRTYAVLLFSGATMLVLLAALSVFLVSGVQLCHGAPSGATSSVPTEFAPPEIQHSWAAYTPYFSVKPYTPPPSYCEITQVNIIQRHGARFPTSGAATRILVAVNKLLQATSYTPALGFLANYTYALGKDNLVPFGASQSEEAGKGAYTRYSGLISKDNIPFVRASSSQRVVDSATNWTTGFSLASHGVFNPSLSVVLSEGANDTLDDAMCPSAGPSDPQTGVWTAIYGAPIAARLNAQAPGAGLVPADISNLIPLCAFETAANEILSPFCAIFTPEEFAEFEYFGDLDKYYNTGYGQALGPVQGVGYINELLARLTESAVKDNTQTNRTLDASPITFPLDRTVYADFSHDNQMIAIYAAMGLFKQALALDPTAPDPARNWIASHLTPFSARMVTERLTCSVHADKGKGAREKEDTFVRILVNDALQPLEFCGGDKNGLCTLSAFVGSQAYSRNDGEGDFEKCFI